MLASLQRNIIAGIFIVIPLWVTIWVITFLTNCALDENFNPWQVVQAAEHQGEHYNFYQRMLLQPEQATLPDVQHVWRSVSLSLWLRQVQASGNPV